MNARTAVLGFLLGLSLGVGVVVASQSFSIKGIITVPGSCSVKISGLRENALGFYELPSMTLSRNASSCQWDLSNTGSKNVQIMYSVDSSDPALVVQLEAYIEHQSYGDVLASQNYFTLKRGEQCSMRLTITDAGLQAGQQYEFTILLQASEA